jgi:translation initiation factor IF-1
MDSNNTNSSNNNGAVNNQKANTTAFGIVTEALPDTLFRVKLDGKDDIVLAYLAGKMRMHRIRVLIGDKVELELDPYGGRARITKRF